MSVLTHRLKGDTSPLAGLLPANAVRGCEPTLAEEVTRHRFPRWEPQFETEKPVKPLRGRSLGTKLSEVEYARVEAAALKAGVGLSEWCRRAVLEFAEREVLNLPRGSSSPNCYRFGRFSSALCSR